MNLLVRAPSIVRANSVVLLELVVSSAFYRSMVSVSGTILLKPKVQLLHKIRVSPCYKLKRESLVSIQ